MAIKPLLNPNGPKLKLILTSRIASPKAVQKWRLGFRFRICLKCEKAELGICTVCFYCPLAAKSWIASEHCPEHKWGIYPLGSDDDSDGTPSQA